MASRFRFLPLPGTQPVVILGYQFKEISMKHLRQSTAILVPIGPIVSVSDGFTRVASLSLSTADVAELMKDNSSAVTDISAATLTATTGADGYYTLSLTASHTDTVGQLSLLIADDSLILPYRQDFMIMPQQRYDSLYGTDRLEVDTKEVNSTTVIGVGTSGDKWRA